MANDPVIAADIVPGLKFRDTFGIRYHVIGIVEFDEVLVIVWHWDRRIQTRLYMAETPRTMLRRFEDGYYRKVNA